MSLLATIDAIAAWAHSRRMELEAAFEAFEIDAAERGEVDGRFGHVVLNGHFP
jgi:hypothetical protein